MYMKNNALTQLQEKIKNYTINGKNIVFFGRRIRLNSKQTLLPEFKQSSLYKEILAATNFLPKNIGFSYRLKAIFQNIQKNEYCPICNKPCGICKNISLLVDFFSHTCNSNHCKMVHMLRARKTTDAFKLHHSIA